MAKIRYRVQIFFDVFIEEIPNPNGSVDRTKQQVYHIARIISDKIPNSFVGEVKPLPHGSERTWDGEFRKEIK